MGDNAIRQGFRELKDGKEYDNLFAAARCRANPLKLLYLQGLLLSGNESNGDIIRKRKRTRQRQTEPG